MLKLCTRHCVGQITRRANFGFNWYSVGLYQNRRNITTLWLVCGDKFLAVTWTAVVMFRRMW